MTPPLEQQPTRRWLQQAALPPLTGPAGTAERLLLLVHYSVHWAGWVGEHRSRYWDAVLPDRVILATYRADTLRGWWSEISAELDAHPKGPAERAEIAALLEEEALPVLSVLREQTAALILRTRIVADEVRAARATTTTPSSP